MKRHVLVIAAALSIGLPACTVTMSGGTDVGTQMDNGTIYLGWHLLSKKKREQETFTVGAEHGQFKSIYLSTNHTVNVSRIVVFFDDGSTFEPEVGGKWGKGHQTPSVELPGGARAITQIDVFAKSAGKHLAKIEIYGVR